MCAIHGSEEAPEVGRSSGTRRGLVSTNVCASFALGLAAMFTIDTISHNPQLLRFLIEMTGSDRVVIGSDYNFDAGYPQPVEFVLRIPELTKREREMILCENAVRVLKLKERFRHVYDALRH